LPKNKGTSSSISTIQPCRQRFPLAAEALLVVDDDAPTKVEVVVLDADEPTGDNIADYYDLRQQLDILNKDLRDVLNHPTYALPFPCSGTGRTTARACTRA
jgi:hypothetical protein